MWSTYRHVRRDLQRALERQLLDDFNLSGADYALLVPLSESPDGVLRPRQLGAEVGWERSRLSHQIGRMEKRGLVTREACEDDARGSLVRLTAAGRAAIEEAAPRHAELVRRLFLDPFTADEVAQLGRLLGRVRAAVDAEGAGDTAEARDAAAT